MFLSAAGERGSLSSSESGDDFYSASGYSSQSYTVGSVKPEVMEKGGGHGSELESWLKMMHSHSSYFTLTEITE